jgi:hypothetical protein
MNIALVVVRVVTLLTVCAYLIVPLRVTPQPSSCSKSERSGEFLGSRRNALFEEATKSKQRLATREQSQEDPHSLADLNRDGRCDRRDLSIFRQVIGKCLRPGSSVLVAEADLDGDGCVTRKDKEIFFQLWRVCKAGKADNSTPRGKNHFC